jgi:transposase-like protein
MDLEVTRHPGVDWHERPVRRTGQRNGSGDRQWDTLVGSIDRKVPKVRDGSFYPHRLDPC